MTHAKHQSPLSIVLSLASLLMHGRATDSKSWLCKSKSAPACTGPAAKNLHVAFTGENTLEIALNRSLVQLSECRGADRASHEA